MPAQGVGGGHNTRIETAAFLLFRFLFFLLTQVRQVKVVFLRTLRNAATRLNPTLDEDGVLRAQTRLEFANIDNEARRPITKLCLLFDTDSP